MAACSSNQPPTTPTADNVPVTVIVTENNANTNPTATSVRPTFTPGPTPTPRPLGSPVLLDRSPVSGEELLLDKPIVLNFDQAMDRASVEGAVQVKDAEGAAIAGHLEWSNDTTAQFIPTNGWQRAAGYSIDISDQAKSAKGLALARPERFNISTIGNLDVAQTIPADGAADVSADASITVLFNRPVVPLTTLSEQANLPQPVTFDPPIDGTGEWLNTSIYIFRPSQALAGGTQYRATVAAGLKDTTDAMLAGDVSWTFTAAAPVVRFSNPTEALPDVDITQPISLTFSQKMDHPSTEAAFSIDPPVKGNFVWADEAIDPNANGARQGIGGETAPTVGTAPRIVNRGETLAFVPQEAMARATQYTVRVGNTAKSAIGGAGLQADYVLRFTTILTLGVRSTTPANNNGRAATNSGFQIKFTAPVLADTILPNLRFDPQVSTTNVYSYYSDYDKTFSLNVNLQPSSRYTVTIGKGIADSHGATLGQDTVVQFSTGPLPPFAALQTANRVGTYNGNLPTTLFVSYRNVTKLNFQLSALTAEDFYTLTGSSDSYNKFTNYTAPKDKILRTWAFNTITSLNEGGLHKAQLDANGGALAPGIYMLTLSAPEVAALDPNYQPEKHILVVSKLHATFKRGDRNGLVWVTDLTSGQPLGGLAVSFRNKNFEEIATATTDDGADTLGQALADFPPTFRAYDQSYALIGQPGNNNFALVYSDMADGINSYDFQLPSRYSSDPFYAYLYTDRPIYRPGQMVFFKGIARADNDARYTVSPDLTAVNVTVNSPQGQVVFSQSVALDPNGTFNGEFALDNAAATGSYYLQACLPIPAAMQPPVSNPNETQPQCSYYGVPFLVATYRAPEFEVNLNTDKADYKQGDTINATVEAKFFAGGNVANAKVQWTLTARDFIFDRYTGPGNYSFGDYDYDFGYVYGPGYGEAIANGSGQTDADGKLTISVPADIAKRRTSAIFALEVSLTDANDQSVSSRTESTVHKGDFYIGIAPENYVGSTNQEFKANVITVDWQGKPLASKDLKVGFYQRTWYTSQEEDAFGRREFTSVPSDTLTTEQNVSTDAEGKGSVVFTPSTGGEYRIKASAADQANSSVVAGTSVYVSSDTEYVAWRVNNNDRLDLKSDKDLYQVGETAKILVPSPFVGPVTALLTVERGGFLSRKTITLNSNSDILEIPIDQSLAPNAFVSVLLVKGVDAKNPLPSYKLGYAQFKVDPKDFALNIAITPDKTQYAPRDTATYDLKVTDAAGNPVQAELSLSLVDKAVLSLADDNSGLLLDSFYGLRGISVRTADTLSVNVDRITQRIAADAGKGGGGGGEASANAFIRRNFKDTAYWSAIVNSDASGNARVSIVLPDNLTTWVMDARAVTADTKVGQAKNEVLSTKALLVRPVTPRFFIAGDKVTLGAVVNNNSDKDINAEVRLDAKGLKLDTIPAQQIVAKAHATTRADWNVEVEDAAKVELTFSVNGGGLQDIIQPGLVSGEGGPYIPVLRYASPETIGTAGDVAEAGKKTEMIALPPRLDTGMGQLSIQIDPSLAAASAQGLKALDEYPYESIDWVACRLMANVASARYLQKTGLGDQAALKSKLDSLVTRGLQRLLTEQKSDGGWGWWLGDDSNPLLTAIVLQSMAQAKQSGYAVDDGSFNRAKEFVSSKLTSPSTLGSISAANRQVYFAFALAEAGAGDSGRLGALYENREKLSHYAKALLAMALQTVQPDDERIKTLLADIQSAAIASATGVTWQEPVRDFENFYGSTRSTSIILAALARLDPQNALAANAVRWLMVARQAEGAWASVQENAWAVTALADWMVATGDLDANYDWRVTLNDTSVLNGKADQSNLTEPARLNIEVAKLLTNQANQLDIERGAGSGHLYYTARLTVYLPADEVKAANRGIVIARKYERADCAPKPGQPCPAIDSAKIGENVRVRLTIVAPSALYYLNVNDPFPGGVEAVDTTLKTAQQTADVTASSDGSAFGFGGIDGWGWWWFSHTELRDDHAALFASYLPAGTYEYTYVTRPSIAGQFKVMPANASLTYFPEVFGRSDGGLFTVTK